MPGYNGKEQSVARLKYEAEEIGFPVLIKASAGGGGKGMRIVNSADELEAAFDAAKRESEKVLAMEVCCSKNIFRKQSILSSRFLVMSMATT